MMWGRDEDSILKALYPQYGPRWDGWETRLPGRSEASIKGRARYLHVIYEDGQRRRETKVIGDPVEGMVMSMMHKGLAPSDIDKALKKPRGWTRRVVVGKWEREKAASL